MVDNNHSYYGQSVGVPQTDLLFLHALREGIAEIRQYPVLLEFIFQDLFDDPLQIKYGNSEFNKIVNWFKSSNIAVIHGFMNYDKPSLPLVTFRCLSSDEDKSLAHIGDGDNVIGDYEVEEIKVRTQPRIWLGPFTPTYDLETGLVTLPSDVNGTSIFPGQYLVSKSTKKRYQVLTTPTAGTFTIQTNVRDNFTDAYIQPAFSYLRPKYREITLKNLYEIGCYTMTEPAELVWLTAIVRFILVRNRKCLLEQNNINLSSFKMGPMEQDLQENTQVNILSQNIIVESISEMRVVEEFGTIIEGITPIEVIVTSNNSNVSITVS